jgi:beta-glucanase (GH16 family)
VSGAGRLLARVLAAAGALLLAWTTAGCDTTPLVQPAPVTTNRTLMWADEFDGAAGTAPSAAHWTYDVGTDWGNNQLEYDTDRTENVSLDGSGHLALTARKESYLGQPYTSGRIHTGGLFAQGRGRFEARIRMPSGRGMWPAFWLLGDDIATTGWPDCGEIDIVEYKGQEPNIVHGSLHGPGYSGGTALTKAYGISGPGFDADFHVFAVEWETNKITYLVDDVPYQVLTPQNLPPGGTWVFAHPFRIVLDLAVGGNYVGPPDASTSFPQTMLVDYVRVYQARS